MRIPESNFNRSISSSAPTPKNPIEGSLAIGQAVENLGSTATKIGLDMTEIKAKTDAFNFYEQRGAQDRADVAEFTTMTSKLINKKTGNIDAGTSVGGRKDINGNITGGATIEQNTPYQEVIKKYQDDLLSKAEVEAPNQFAVDGYKQKVGSFYEINSLEAKKHEIDTFFKGTIATIDDSEDSMGKRLQYLGSKIYEDPTVTLKKAEDDVVSQFKTVNAAEASGALSQEEAEAKRVRAADTGATSLFSGIENSLRNPTLKGTKKIEFLNAFSKLADEATKKNNSPLFYKTSVETHNKLQKLASSYNIDLRSGAAKEAMSAMGGFQEMVISSDGSPESNLKLDGVQQDITDNILLGASPLESSEIIGKMKVSRVAGEVVRDINKLPASQMDAFYKNKISEVKDNINHDVNAMLDTKQFPHIKPDMLNGELISKLGTTFEAMKASIIKERQDDPVKYITTKDEVGKALYDDWNSESNPSIKGKYLKQLINYTNSKQTTLTETPLNKQDTYSKPMTEQLVGEFNQLAKDFSTPGSLDKFKALAQSIGPVYMNALNSQATKNGIKNHNKNIFSATLFTSDEPTMNMVLELETKRDKIEENYKIDSQNENQKPKDIDVAISSRLAKYNEHASININGIPDTSANDSIAETGKLYVKEYLHKHPGATAEEAAQLFDDNVASKAFKLIDTSGSKIQIPANIPSKPIEDFVSHKVGNHKWIDSLEKDGFIYMPKGVMMDPATGKENKDPILAKEQWKFMVKNKLQFQSTDKGLVPYYQYKGAVRFLTDAKNEKVLYKWEDVISDSDTLSYNELNWFQKGMQGLSNGASTPETNADAIKLKSMLKQNQDKSKSPSIPTLKPKKTNSPSGIKKPFKEATELPVGVQMAVSRLTAEYKKKDTSDPSDIWSTANTTGGE